MSFGDENKDIYIVEMSISLNDANDKNTV